MPGQTGVLLACGGAVLGLGAAWCWHAQVASQLRAQLQQLTTALQQTEAALSHEKDKRAADRAGRVRAEQEVRRLQLALVTLQTEHQQPPTTTAVPYTLDSGVRAQHQQPPPTTAASSTAGSGPIAEHQQPPRATASNTVGPETSTEHQQAGASGIGLPADSAEQQQQQQQQQAGAPASSVGSLEASGQQQQQHEQQANGSGRGGAPSLPATSLSAYPFRPIGHVLSCFSQRNGTPRQPQLVEAARAVVQLAPDIPAACLEGLTLFSHCWILFVFHENTDLGKALSPDRGVGVKAKIRVPRLDGGKLGVLATRSPHRPAPIGLSVAKVIGVQGRQLILGGVDVVHGSPVLDIKPYVPFCDSLAGATAPAWVAAEAEDEPLRMAGVVVTDQARQQLQQAWQRTRRTSLYTKAADFITLVEQVLARDIRSFHQRSQPQGQQHLSDPPSSAVAENIAPGRPTSTDHHVTAAAQGAYHVVLEGVDISYDVSADGVVNVMGAHLATATGLDR